MSGSQKHHNALPPQEQLDGLLNSQWESEILPQLPKELEEAAKRLKAFQRVRQVASATDLLRALLVYALYSLPWRQLGAWAVLVGLGNLCERAWRKRTQPHLPGGWRPRHGWFTNPGNDDDQCASQASGVVRKSSYVLSRCLS